SEVVMDNPKKEEILRACLKEFAEYGFEKANTNRICEHAGVSKGLIFHYFGSKQHLFMLTVEKCVDELMARFEGFSVAGLGFIEATLAYARLKADFFAANPDQYRVLTQAFMQTPEALKAELLERYAKLHAIGMEIMASLLAKLELRPGVSEARAMEMITVVLGSLEQKYVPILSAQARYTDELSQQLTQEYTELMDMVLYGVAEHREH
ncbi:MAG: TetR/AcrR family transcriptional regulator, partial [Bacillota bacterium]